MNKKLKYPYLIVFVILVFAVIACSTGEKFGGNALEISETETYELLAANSATMEIILANGLTATFVAPTPTFDPQIVGPTATAQNEPSPRTDTHPCTGKQAGAQLTVGSTYEQNNVKFWLEGTKLMTNIRWLGPFDLDENWKQVSSIESHCFRILNVDNKKYLQILVKSN